MRFTIGTVGSALLLPLVMAGCATPPRVQTSDARCIREQLNGESGSFSGVTLGQAAHLCHMAVPDLSNDPDLANRALAEHVPFLTTKQDKAGENHWYYCHGGLSAPSCTPLGFVTPAEKNG